MIKLAQPNVSERAILRINEILRSGQLVHGEECKAFENELANYLGSKHVLVVSNGTAALHLALLSLDIGVGDAVIVPDFTFVATANAVEITGARAIIADVEVDSYNMNPDKLIDCIENWEGPERLKAIMPVLEFGNSTNISKYKEIAANYNLFLIEDAACALGANLGNEMVGTFGHFGCFSFHPRKTLTTGEGGAIATNDSNLFNKAMLLRNHGMILGDDSIEFKCIGLNYRLTNFQAVMGRDALLKLDVWIEKRRQLASIYLRQLAFLEKDNLICLPKIPQGHSVQTFMIVLNDVYDRKMIMNELYCHGIESNLGAQSISALGLFDHKSIKQNSYKVGNRLFRNGLALPIHESMTKQDVLYVTRKLSEILTHD